MRVCVCLADSSEWCAIVEPFIEMEIVFSVYQLKNEEKFNNKEQHKNELKFIQMVFYAWQEYTTFITFLMRPYTMTTNQLLAI